MSTPKPICTDNTLEFTGERFVPECVREIWYEHWHRYAFALGFARGKRVLDLACGEGYGSNILSKVAKLVHGGDIDEQSIAHARKKYRADNLRFIQSSCDAIALEAESVDLVVSFETLEHVQPQAQMLAEFSRVLAPDGLLLISTPDKRLYSDATGYQNEYHVKELYREEFETLIGQQFPAYRLFGQKLLFQSAIWPLDRENTAAELLTTSNAAVNGKTSGYPAVYLIALCAKSETALEDAASTLSLFGDTEESVYQHYNDEVRRNIHAGKVLKDYEAIIQRQQAEIERLNRR